MKTKIIFILVMALAQLSHSQISVGPKINVNLQQTKKFSEKKLQELKNTTTVFVLQFKDYDQEKIYREAIKSVWTITPFKVIRPEEIDKYSNEKFSIFTLDLLQIQITRGASTSNRFYFTYDLSIPFRNKKNKIRPESYAKIFLSPDHETLKATLGLQGRLNFTSNVMNYMYNDASFCNWGPGFLKGYLKTINDLLLEGKNRNPYYSFEDKEALQSLKGSILYVTDDIYTKANAFIGPLKSKSAESEDDGLDDGKYKFSVKVVSPKELNELIMNSEEPIKYLIFSRMYPSNKKISVFDSKTAKLIYTDFRSMSLNFNKKDLRKISNLLN
ncbi:MAG TPA: hypothetical protein VLZ83_05215 [Edaphocola sp.]|nr:hypothetical protein [Edaphocola sp.]